MVTDPSTFLRQFHLTSVDGGMAWDMNYNLVFASDGRMFVRIAKTFEQPYTTPDIHEIDPRDFSKISVEGVPLHQIVARKLNEILPSGS